MFYKFLIGGISENSPKYYDTDLVSEKFIVIPLVKLLNLFGFSAWNDGANLFFHDLEAGRTSSVLIAESCSGIISVTIFLAAILAYLTLNYNIYGGQMSFLLIISGVLISYICNLLRMVILVIAGHFYGLDLLLWLHANLGWLIFSLWMFAFFSIVDKLSQNILQDYNKSNRLE